MDFASDSAAVEAQIATTFQKHYDYYSGIGNETRVQQLKDEQSIKLQYGGRTVFELLQNAFDRADNVVLIAQSNSASGAAHLLVGNDGQSVTVDAAFDYSGHVREGENRRSDFHALCSLHTSNKAPDESIGNKGVGFRSVFSLASYVRVYSRLPDEGNWWGIELHWRLRRQRLLERLQIDSVREGWKRFLGNREIPLHDDIERPSFYFPLPVWQHDPVAELSDGDHSLTTIIELPLESPEARNDVCTALGELAKSHFFFVGLRESKRSVRIDVDDGSQTCRRSTWPRDTDEDAGVSEIVAWPPNSETRSLELDALADMAKRADHAVSRPRVALAWPNPGSDGANFGKRYCYLPTLVESPLGVDVHGDFQLGIDRTTLKCEDSDDVGKYNRALLEVAAELHLVCCLRHLGYDGNEIREWADWSWIKEPTACEWSSADLVSRDDLWRYLHPRDRANDHQVRHLEKLVFGIQENWRNSSASFARWAELAKRFFSVDRPLRAFDEFWVASKGWIDSNPHGYGSHTKTWKGWAVSLCDALRVSGARVVPVIPTLETVPDTVMSTHQPLPDRPGVGSRAERRLYIRRGGDDRAGDMHLPEGLRRRGRLVSCYRFVDGINELDASPNPTGALPLDRAALLRELRQLPTNIEKWTFEPLDEYIEIARQQQYALLKFAAELFVAQFGTQKSLQEQFGDIAFTWRVQHGLELGEDLRAAGRALATVFLPTADNEWQPARQLTHDNVDREWLSWLGTQVVTLDKVRFLSFLGVAPSGQELVLVEDGDAGIVKPVPAPPSLIEADTLRIRAASIPLRGLNEKANRPLVAAIRDAWPKWLSSIVNSENQGQQSTTVAQTLRELAWYPVGSSGATQPIGADPTVTHVRPIDIVLEKIQDRRTKVLWTTSVDSDRSMLRDIGSVGSLSDDDLRRDSARAATTLWKQIQNLDLNVAATSPVARQGLLELFQSLLSAVATAADPAAEPIPLLAYAPADKERPFPDRALHWITTEEEGWIAEDNNQRELLRRFFPQLPVVCATVGPKVVKQQPWLSVRSISVDYEIAQQPLEQPVESLADQIRSRLEDLLPALLAIAEVSRYTTQRINPQHVNDVWTTTRLVQAANVWVDFTAAAEDLEPKTASWLKDSKNDVIVNQKSGIIFFDTDQENHEGPPLRAFGEALAARLLEDRRVGPAWSNAITEHEVGGDSRLDELLRKSGAQALCESYRRELRPLTREAQQQIVARIQASLAQLGTSLKAPENYTITTRILTPESLTVPNDGWRAITEDDVQRCLDDASWTDTDYVFKPEFQCGESNRQTWEKWLEAANRRLRLLILATALESGVEITSRREANTLLTTPMAQRLSSSSSEIFACVAFEPVVAAKAWLSETITDLDHKLGERANLPLEQLLPEITRYQPVAEICTATSASWSRSTVGDRKPTQSVLAPVTPESKAEEDAAKLEVGGDAEVALRMLVNDRTAAILADDPSCWDVLSAALPPKGVIRRKFEEARNQSGLLEDALHVSATWGSAGYDLVGLELSADSGGIEVVRYEVKALPAEGDRIRVFLSPNELAVYRRVVRNGRAETEEPRYRGDWRLVGVEPEGRAVDITEFLSPLLDDSEGPLASLGRDGFAPDGLMLSINRGGPKGGKVGDHS